MPMTVDRRDSLWMVLYPYYLYKITSNAVVTRTGPLSLPAAAQGLCADSQGNLYMAAGNQVFRYTTNAVLSVFAGSGNPGYADGNGILTAFFTPTALAADAADNIYVWDSGNYVVRRIDQSRNATTVAGNRQNGSNVDGLTDC